MQFSISFVSDLERVFRFIDPHFGLVQLGWLPGPDPLTLRDTLSYAVRDQPRVRQLARALAPRRWRVQVEQDPLTHDPPQWGTHCYLVSAEMAGELLPHRAAHLLTHRSFLPGLRRVQPSKQGEGLANKEAPLATQDVTMGSDIAEAHLGAGGRISDGSETPEHHVAHCACFRLTLGTFPEPRPVSDCWLVGLSEPGGVRGSGSG